MTIMKIKNLYYRIDINRKIVDSHKWWNNHDTQFVVDYELPDLTKSELNQIKKTWPSLDVRSEDVVFARVYKKEKGFSPYFIGNYQSSFLWGALNPRDLSVSLENKAYMDYLFPQIPFPKSFIRGITGNLYDAEMNYLSIEEAALILKDKGEFVLKVSEGSSYGEGVKKIKVDAKDSKVLDKIKEILISAGPNFVAQEVLAQHPMIASLNPSSINTCRVTSLYIDGKYGSSTCLKIGKYGSHVDNWRNGYILGIDQEGNFGNEAYDSRLHKVRESDTGVVFHGMKYPAYIKMLRQIESIHKKFFPMCGVIGWDVIVDPDENVRVIEFNLRPEFAAEQLVSGTFFELFHDEICRKIKGSYSLIKKLNKC